MGAAVASGAALFGVKKLKERRDSAAVLALYHALASHPDLGALTAEEIRGVGEKYSVDLAKGRVAEMKSVYDTFVESVIPVEGQLEYDCPPHTHHHHPTTHTVTLFKPCMYLRNFQRTISLLPGTPPPHPR